VSDIAISLPTIIGRSGIEGVLALPLADTEIAGFQRSAQVLQESLATLSA
jgi:malate/lactate dehydrogenase